MTQKSTLITNKTSITLLIETIKPGEHLRVSTEINVKGKDRQIYVGSIIVGAEIHKRNPFFCRADERVFYRSVKNWNDVFSYREETISLNIGLYWFLLENKISAVFTYAEDEARLNAASLESFRFESCLNQQIGWLRRAQISDTISLLNQDKIKLGDYDFTRTVVAEKRAHSKVAKPGAKTVETNLNQRGLFD